MINKGKAVAGVFGVVGFGAAARRRQVAARHVPQPCDVMGPFFCRKLRVFRPAARPVSALCAPAMVLGTLSTSRGGRSIDTRDCGSGRPAQ